MLQRILLKLGYKIKKGYEGNDNLGRFDEIYQKRIGVLRLVIECQYISELLKEQRKMKNIYLIVDACNLSYNQLNIFLEKMKIAKRIFMNDLRVIAEECNNCEPVIKDFLNDEAWCLGFREFDDEVISDD